MGYYIVISIKISFSMERIVKRIEGSYKYTISGPNLPGKMGWLDETKGKMIAIELEEIPGEDELFDWVKYDIVSIISPKKEQVISELEIILEIENERKYRLFWGIDLLQVSREFDSSLHREVYNEDLEISPLSKTISYSNHNPV